MCLNFEFFDLNRFIQWDVSRLIIGTFRSRKLNLRDTNNYIHSPIANVCFSLFCILTNPLIERTLFKSSYTLCSFTQACSKRKAIAVTQILVKFCILCRTYKQFANL